MTNPPNPPIHRSSFIIHRFLPLLLLIIPLLYLLTLARTPVLGDPSEYTVVAHTLGIAHPPGYAFITLAGKLFQTIIPIGTIAWRTHLLAATSATIAALAIYGIIRHISQKLDFSQKLGFSKKPSFLSLIPPLFAAFTVATATNFWQHAIHTNPHIITATFLAVNLYLLTRWSITESDYPLYAFCLSAGLGVTHHPLTVFAFPAYAIFIIAVRPAILRNWRTLLKMVGFALLGLSIWLYYPLRSPQAPPFGPSDMATLDGFLNVVLARGLRVNLFHFGLADQLDRLTVFWTTLRLQYALPVIFLALFGWSQLIANSQTRKLALLYTLAFLGNYIFVINSVQDVMAYLLGPFMMVGLLAGSWLGGLAGLGTGAIAARSGDN